MPVEEPKLGDFARPKDWPGHVDSFLCAQEGPALALLLLLYESADILVHTQCIPPGAPGVLVKIDPPQLATLLGLKVSTIVRARDILSNEALSPTGRKYLEPHGLAVTDFVLLSGVGRRVRHD